LWIAGKGGKYFQATIAVGPDWLTRRYMLVQENPFGHPMEKMASGSVKDIMLSIMLKALYGSYCCDFILSGKQIQP
jgi:hypothetical protein